MQDATGVSLHLAQVRPKAKSPVKALILDGNAFDRWHFHRLLLATRLPPWT
jgi:hypothetical protein